MESVKDMVWPERRIRRAAAACYRCHWRKVRCDAAVLGSPCTNCTLDRRTDCTLRPNVTARFKRLQQNGNPQSGASAEIIPPTAPGLSAYEAAPEVISSPSPDIRVPEPSTQIDLADGVWNGAGDPCSVDGLVVEDSSTAAPGQYFLALDRVSSLPMDDVHVLVTNGSLDIPPKDLVDVFLRKYFLVIHPSLPILNEVQFWNIYLHANGNLNPSQKVSLFVFQAMLLASCSVLYDTGFESNPLARAQGAALLTFHTTAEDPEATMTWNLCSIQNAIAIGQDTQVPDADASRIAKKRLIWSVFVRDRILWLGRHRRPQFISANFNVTTDYLDEDDVADEIMFSPVYGADAKRSLLKIFQAQCRLAVILTGVISIAFTSSDGYVPRLSWQGLQQSLARVERLKSRLALWKDEVDVQVPMHNPQHEIIDVIVNLTYMYYQNARMALSHHQTLLVEEHVEMIQERSATILLGIAKDLQSSMSHLTQTMAFFASRHLPESIPLSVLAYCGTPLILSAIDMHLSPSYTHSLNRQHSLNNCTEVIRQSREAYDVTELFSNGTNHILQLAYTITQNLFRDTNNPPSPAHHPENAPFTNLRVTSWIHAFLKHPRAYLLLSTCIDSSLATGHLPPDGSFLPAIVRQTVPLTLGVARLPWAIDAPTPPVGGKRHRIGRACSRDEGTFQLPLDDTWYWSLLH
ncbi:hypothetical protein P168DRAFT_221156, partial [Aspergillus campestris IBT 28561]